MKDESRAKWEDELAITSAYKLDYINCWCAEVMHGDRIEARANALTEEIAQARAKQICALPAMVALLKEISEQTLYCDTGEYEATDFHYDAKAILAQIGEGE